MNVLVAPDSFKGTMTAGLVAENMARGCSEANSSTKSLPLADGGEGTAEILGRALGGYELLSTARSPLGDPIKAPWYFVDGSRVAIIDVAAASGLHLVPPSTEGAIAASTYGTGQMLLAAALHGARSILLCSGGSATTDGGQGALKAVMKNPEIMADVRLTVLCDVATPFERCAQVYGPQKGADEKTVEVLTDRLQSVADRLRRDPRGIPRTGSAGGLAGALWSELDAQLVSGINYVLDALDFDAALAAADLVITGEGRLDAQTAEGKVISGVLRRAADFGVPVWALVGRSDLTCAQVQELGLAGVLEARDPDELRNAARRVVRQAVEHP